MHAVPGFSALTGGDRTRSRPDESPIAIAVHPAEHQERLSFLPRVEEATAPPEVDHLAVTMR